MPFRLIVPLLVVGVLSCGPAEQGVVDQTSVGGGGGQASSAVSGMPCEVASVLAAKCVSCHGATPVGGAPNSLVTRDDLLEPSALGGTIAARCVVRVKDAASPMPPSYTGDSLTASEVAGLQGWVESGFVGGACSSALTGGDAGAGASGGGAGGGAMSGGGAGGGVGGVGGGTGTGGGGGMTNGGAAGGGIGGMGGGTGTGGGGGTANGGGAGGSATGGSGTGGGSSTGGAGGGAATGGGSGTTADAGTACTTDTWANYGASFFANTCTSCHHHSGDFATATSVRASRSTITSRIASGNMPQGTTLNATQKTRILSYLNCGAP